MFYGFVIMMKVYKFDWNFVNPLQIQFNFIINHLISPQICIMSKCKLYLSSWPIEIDEFRSELFTRITRLSLKMPLTKKMMHLKLIMTLPQLIQNSFYRFPKRIAKCVFSKQHYSYPYYTTQSTQLDLITYFVIFPSGNKYFFLLIALLIFPVILM